MAIVAVRMIKALVRPVSRSREWNESSRTDEARPTAHHNSGEEGQNTKEGTARAILRQAGVSEDEFFDVY